MSQGNNMAFCAKCGIRKKRVTGRITQYIVIVTISDTFGTVFDVVFTRTHLNSRVFFLIFFWLVFLAPLIQLSCHPGLQRRVPRVDLLLPVPPRRRLPGHRPRPLQGRHRGGGVRLRRHLVPPHLGQGSRLDAGHAGADCDHFLRIPIEI